MNKEIIKYETGQTTAVVAKTLGASIREHFLTLDENGETKQMLKDKVALERISKAIDLGVKNNDVKNALMSAVEREATDGKGSMAEIDGAKVSVAATYTAYDFSDCGHTELTAIELIRDELKLLEKSIKDELKGIPPAKGVRDWQTEEIVMKGGTKKVIIDDRLKQTLIQCIYEAKAEEGEVLEVKPPIKKQTMGVKVTGK